MIRTIAVTFLLITLTLPALAQELRGKVIGITDGDTITLMTKDHEKHKIRLAEIDTPEKGQPYGQKARQALADLIFQEDVSVIKTTIDRYGRVIGKVYKDELYINAAMLKAGAAWVYRDYSDDENMLELERVAKDNKRGLWALAEAERLPPWEWRKLSQEEINEIIKKNGQILPESVSKRERSNTAIAPGHNSVQGCGLKQYCKQMSSCSEARHYLLNCGVNTLDGDKDGVPCENLCGG